MKNEYFELQKREQERFDSLPIKFAFSDEQLKQAIKEFGLKESETDKLCKISDNGIMRKDEVHLFNEFLKENEKAMKEAMDSDTDGTGFLYQMFRYELANHEYNITYSVDETLDVLGITVDDIKKDDRLRKALDLAKEDVLKNSDW